MAYRESGATWSGGGITVADIDGVDDEGWGEPARRRGSFAFRAPEAVETARIEGLARDEEERLKEDFRRLQVEARNEFKSVRSTILQQYEERLVAAKEQYLEDAVASRERLLMNRQQAREEYEEALRNARNNYEFTVDIVKDHYQTIRRETTRIIRFDGMPDGELRTAAPAHEESPSERASTRVIARLDEEIRKVAAKKAAEEAKTY